MSAFKDMVCQGTYYYLCGVRDQYVWNELMLKGLGIGAQPLLEDIWLWSTECVKHHKPKRRKLLNCWEFMNCRQGGGKCKASMEARLHGIHGGENGGRACWAVTRTVGRDRDQSRCKECAFYRKVHEEQLDHILEDRLLKELLRMRM